jgi:hypothetical protein
MGIMTWAARLASKFLPRPVNTMVGLARKVLRAIVSQATKMEAALPDIVDTMQAIDPGKAYGEWSTQYRAMAQGLSVEKRLALWDKNTPFDESVMTYEHLRRARKYRYIFSLNIVDMNTGNDGWKMFSLYSNKLMAPQEVIDKFFEETFSGKYGNHISYTDFSFYRVQRWTK